MKPLHLQFEDDLADLIDQYLMRDIDIEDLKGVLRDEAENDLEQVRSSLRSWARRSLSPHQSAPANQGSLPSGESDPTVMLDLAGADTIARQMRDRPAGGSPGGMYCDDCFNVFIGAEWHERCAICEAARNVSDMTKERKSK